MVGRGGLNGVNAAKLVPEEYSFEIERVYFRCRNPRVNIAAETTRRFKNATLKSAMDFHEVTKPFGFVKDFCRHLMSYDPWDIFFKTHFYKQMFQTFLFLSDNSLSFCSQCSFTLITILFTDTLVKNSRVPRACV